MLTVVNCSRDPCENGGACSDFGESFICSCSIYFAGITCDQSKIARLCSVFSYLICAIVLPIRPSWTIIVNRLTHGNCLPLRTTEVLLADCVRVIAEVTCGDTPCANNATCMQLLDGFSCACTAYYRGDICDQGMIHSPV